MRWLSTPTLHALALVFTVVTPSAFAASNDAARAVSGRSGGTPNVTVAANVEVPGKRVGTPRTMTAPRIARPWRPSARLAAPVVRDPRCSYYWCGRQVTWLFLGIGF